MTNSELALVFVNEYLDVFGMDNIKELKDLPRMKRNVFDNVAPLKSIVDKHIDALKTLYGATEISYYTRSRIKNYEYIIFKKVLEQHGLKLKTLRKIEYKEKDKYERTNYCIL
jgi:hypothetical protein